MKKFRLDVLNKNTKQLADENTLAKDLDRSTQFVE